MDNYIKELYDMNLQQIEKRYAELEAEIKAAKRIEELDGMEEKINAVIERRNELRAFQARKEAELKLNNGVDFETFVRKAVQETKGGNFKMNEHNSEIRNYIINGEETSEMRSQTLSNSGAVLPETIFNKMLTIGVNDNANLLDKVSVSKFKHSGTIKIPVATASSSEWHTEFDDIKTETKAIENIKLGGYELAKILSISAAAHSMTDARFEDYLGQLLNEEMGATIEKAIISGDGVNKPTGILSGVTWEKSKNYVETTEISVDDIISGIALLPSKYKKNAYVIGNRNTIYNKVRKLKDDQKRYIMDIDGANATILGVPVVIAEDMPENTLVIGDLSKYFLNFSQDIILEKSRESGFRTASIDIRALAVLDGKPFADAFVKVAVA